MLSKGSKGLFLFITVFINILFLIPVCLLIEFIVTFYEQEFFPVNEVEEGEKLCDMPGTITRLGRHPSAHKTHRDLLRYILKQHKKQR